MKPGIELQLEALKMLQEWSIWQVTLCSGLSWGLVAVLKNADDSRIYAYTKWAFVFIFLSVLGAVLLVGATAAQVQHIDLSSNEIECHSVFFGLSTARGIYASKYLDIVPVWYLSTAQRMCFLIGSGFGLWAFLLQIQGKAHSPKEGRMIAPIKHSAQE